MATGKQLHTIPGRNQAAIRGANGLEGSVGLSPQAALASTALSDAIRERQVEEIELQLRVAEARLTELQASVRLEVDAREQMNIFSQMEEGHVLDAHLAFSAAFPELSEAHRNEIVNYRLEDFLYPSPVSHENPSYDFTALNGAQKALEEWDVTGVDDIISKVEYEDIWEARDSEMTDLSDDIGARYGLDVEDVREVLSQLDVEWTTNRNDYLQSENKFYSPFAYHVPELFKLSDSGYDSDSDAWHARDVLEAIDCSSRERFNFPGKRFEFTSVAEFDAALSVLPNGNDMGHPHFRVNDINEVEGKIYIPSLDDEVVVTPKVMAVAVAYAKTFSRSARG
jgi:hypothetical protein